MVDILADRIEIHLYYPGRSDQPRKVIAWGNNSVMDHTFAGVSGMEMSAARDSCIAEHVRNFGHHLAVWMRHHGDES